MGIALRRFISTLILTLLISPFIQGQEISFNHITTDNGLIAGNVRSIIEDYQGFIWIGTEDGLQRYDGYSIVNYQHDEKDSTSLSSNYILSLFEDSRKNLWIGTLDAGLCLYDRSTDSFKRYVHNSSDKNSILGSNILVIHESYDSTLYFGFEVGGISYFKTPSAIPASIKFTNVEIPKLKSTDLEMVNAIIEDTDHTFFVGVNGGGLNRFNPATGKFKRLLQDSCSNLVHSLFLDSKNRLWIGSWDNGLYIYDTDSKQLVHHVSKEQQGFLQQNQVESFIEDEEGNYWIGTDNGLSMVPHGADPFSSTPFITYKHNEFESKSLLSNSIKALFMDNRNRLWVGSYYGGINIYDKKERKFYPVKSKTWLPQTLTDNNVFAFAIDSHGTLWVGTDGGGLHRVSGSIQDISKANFIKVPLEINNKLADKIKCLEADRHGNLWIGTWGTGMFKLNTQSNSYEHFGRSSYSGKGLQANEVLFIKADSLDNLWVGTFNGGIHYLDQAQKTITPYTNFSSPGNLSQTNRISSLHIDRKGQVWVGREAGGLSLYEPKTKSFRTIDQGLVSKHLTVLSIHDDMHGVLWLGTNSKGLIRYDPKQNSIKLYSEESGMFNNVVYAILEDTLNNTLWLSTNKGLSVLNLSKNTFANYNKADGLQGNQFNQGSALLHPSGLMLFGGTEGMNVFDPGKIEKSNYLPPLVFTRFWVNNKEINIRDRNSPLSKNIILSPTIELDHTQNSFTAEFAVLEYNPANRNEYKYFLKGLNTAWQNGGTERKAIFTNLNPGTYVLKVKASNSDGLWMENEKSLTIIIHPAWWQTMIFKIALVISALLIAFAFARIRINYLVSQKKKLEGQVAERTAELKHKNEELANKIEEIGSQNKILYAQKIEIAEISQEVQAQNEELTSQNDQISVQRENLEEARGKLKHLNDKLEFLVHERTKKLKKTIAELDKTVAELDRFVYSASHDLSAPLKSVLGLVNIARFEKDPEMLQKYYAYIETSINKLDRVIKSLVEFSRNSQMEVNIVKFNIHQLTQDVLDELAFWPEAQKVTLINKIYPGQYFSSDPDRVKVILHNLISNAIKYADLSKPNPFLQIEVLSNNLIVSDNGIGIEKEKQQKIFDMYYRGTDRSKGSGLGLFIVKEILLKIEGTVEVISAKGEGTTFKLAFKNDDSRDIK